MDRLEDNERKKECNDEEFSGHAEEAEELCDVLAMSCVDDTEKNVRHRRRDRQKPGPAVQ